MVKMQEAKSKHANMDEHGASKQDKTRDESKSKSKEKYVRSQTSKKDSKPNPLLNLGVWT